jgi:hypothetical protein
MRKARPSFGQFARSSRSMVRRTFPESSRGLVLFVVKQAAAGALRLLHGGLARLQRLDVRHRREGGAPTRKRPARRARDEDDIGAIVCGAAWP